MKRRVVFLGAGIVVLVLIVFFTTDFVGNDFGNETETVPTPTPTVASVPVPAPVPTRDESIINWGQYNIDYMNDGVKAILVRKLGTNGRTAFYLPATGYINVSRGTKYGVAFAIQNVNPNVPDGNEFAYNFDADPSSVGDCGVSVDEAQSWIERGWASSGMISGQWREDYNEWYDAMTVYFAFPADIEPCSVAYNFVITKDGAGYDSKTILFNLV